MQWAKQEPRLLSPSKADLGGLRLTVLSAVMGVSPHEERATIDVTEPAGYGWNIDAGLDA